MRSRDRKITQISSYSILTLNLISFLVGLIYLLYSKYNLIWSIFGIFFTIVLASNFAYCFLLSKRINKNLKARKVINYLIYFYLVFIIPAILLMNSGSLAISISYYERFVEIFFSNLLIILGFFIPISVMITIASLVIYQAKDEITWNLFFSKEDSEKHAKKWKKMLSSAIFFLFVIFILVLGIISTRVIIYGSSSRNPFYLGIGITAAQFGLTWTIIFVSIMLLTLKKVGRRLKSIPLFSVLAVGLFLSIVHLLPIMSTPSMIAKAESNFDEAFNLAFNGDWRAEISPNVQQFFLKKHYFLTQYYLGTPTKECTIIKDILYFNGAKSSFDEDKDIRLYFDVYLPPDNGLNLPGENSVLIRIHPGAYSFGDKGITNFVQKSRYFAAQGYVVFDIQYGLIDTNTSSITASMTPEYRKGDFDIHDMIRHIGNFTYYLALHAEDYNANLDSVFISGESSGGHLAASVALGIANGSYPDIFSPDLNIKGYIPLYPSNCYGSTNPFLNPSLFIKYDSPACLILQGEKDHLIPSIIAEEMLEAYQTRGNYNCSIMFMPYGIHSSDVYFPGNYNQVFLYFMERFMYLFH
jgi:acetyl esterase/lipase